MKLSNVKSGFLALLSIILFSFVFFTACDDTETIDETNFTIYYTGMTDIGPSMTGVISSPSYIGGKPSGFEITGITVNGESYTGDSFQINKDEGSITITQTSGIPVGRYKISIRCISNGKVYDYPDIVEINMMKPVPDGITVEPNKLKADYGDVIDPSSEVELPTAQVTTDGDHVSIKKYEIAKSDFSKYFAISSTGVISIVRGDNGLQPGKYVLSLKLSTGANGEDEGIFENAIEIDITSRPLDLTYTPATGKIEEESAISGNTTFISNAPTMKGSLEGLSYSIKSVTPATNKILIDEATGVLSVNSNHGFVAGQKYAVNVNVKNTYSPEGVDFSDVFELEVVTFIEPIENFEYANIEAVQAVAFENSPVPAFKGDEVKYELVDLPAALQGNVSVDIDGKVSAVKGNTIPLGTYTVKVKATNPKSDPDNPAIASFILTVKENPNYFTYVYYGNNLNLEPQQNYPNQFRIPNGGTFSNINSLLEAKSDGKNLKYEIKGIHQAGSITINENTGQITVSGIKKKQCGIVMVTATAGKGTPEEFSIQTPVFFHYSDAGQPDGSSQSVVVEYTPFVFQVNPSKGGRSAKPNIEGKDNVPGFTMDYRRTFNYYNFFGTHISGVPAKDTFIGKIWDTYYANIGKSVAYGSRDPLSYYGSINVLNQALGYIDPNTLEVVINPNKWIYEGEPANGAMIGQITIGSNGKDPVDAKDAGRIFPIVLWFDKNFK